MVAWQKYYYNINKKNSTQNIINKSSHQFLRTRKRKEIINNNTSIRVRFGPLVAHSTFAIDNLLLRGGLGLKSTTTTSTYLPVTTCTTVRVIVCEEKLGCSPVAVMAL
jgi:hypothetical protein